MTHRTVVVVGHVDHGKTALVRALTGMETDRLKEEQARGLSIALGFAWRDYPSGSLDFVDAPGHEDFIRTTVSGATGAPCALLAVSAVEGVRRQTFEHLQIAAMLGISQGVVAATMSDLLAAGQGAARVAEIERALIGTALEGEPIILCSARTGDGLDALNGALDELLRRVAPGPVLPGFFLPVDRAFNVHGIGTVVTGTLLGGALTIGAEAILQPHGRPTVIRGLQTRGQDCAEVEPGRRTAVNLRGVSLDEVAPGDVLCAPGRHAASNRIEGAVSVLKTAARPLRHLEEVRVLIGTQSVVGALRMPGVSEIAPGAGGWVDIRSASLIVAFTGQRGILRRLSPAETLGGLVVLDPAPPTISGRGAERVALLKAVASGDVAAIADALATRDGGLVDLRDLERLTHRDAGRLRAELAEDYLATAGGRLSSRKMTAGLTDAYLTALEDFHRLAPTKGAATLTVIRRAAARGQAAELIPHVEQRLVERGTIRLAGGYVALAGHDPIAALTAPRREQMLRLDALLRQGGVSPPDPTELDDVSTDAKDLLTLLRETGQVVALENHALRKTLMFHIQALHEARMKLSAAFPPPTPFRTGGAREALATSRKFIVPILEHFDTEGWTVRSGDIREMSSASRLDTRPTDAPLRQSE